MPLRLRLALMLLVLGGVVVGTGLVVLAAVGRVEDSRRLVTEVLEPASVQSRALLVALVDQETGQRGYLLTGDEDFLDPYRSGRRDFAASLAALRAELPGDPATLRAVDAVEASARRWRTGAAQPEIAARRSGDLDESADLVRSQQGKQLFDDVRARVETLQTLIDRRVLAAQEADRADLGLLRTSVVTALALLAVDVLLMGILLRRWMLTPVLALRERMRSVARGNLDDEVVIEGPPEIAAISHDAEGMRRRIVRELEATRAASEALRQHSPVVAALGAALAAGRAGPGGSTGDRTGDSTGDSTGPVTVAGVVVAAEGMLAGDTWRVQRRPDGSTAAVVVDVSGHGAEAGLVAFGFTQRLTALLATDLDLATAFAAAADWDHGDQERFVTCAVVAVHPDGRLAWVNAGHPAPLVLDVARAVRAELEPTGPLVSSLAAGWEVGSLQLAADDLVVLYTDGVLEARDAGGTELGEAGLLGALAGLRHGTPAEAVDRVADAVRRFGGGARRDDVTCVALALTPVDARDTRAGGSDPGTTVS